MSLIQLPGLIDIHTHLRVPGGEHKEDFATGTAAALAGGITTILAMPNTSPPLSTPNQLKETVATAKATTHCDLALFAGASPAHLEELPLLPPYTIGLKIYLNDTFGPLRIDELPDLARCFELWPATLPIAMHAEKQSVAVGIGLAATYQRPVHFCHISRKEEIELIANAKMAGLPVSCEVAPHHLFMDQSDFERMGPLADMRPVLGTPQDVASLWAHLSDTIDCIATDHAPHTLKEKRSASPPPGISGLETSLALMLTAVHENRITLERVKTLMFDNPKRLFHLPTPPETYIVVDVDSHWTITNEQLYTKCGWTPFAGKTVHGSVQEVVYRGNKVFANGRLLSAPGSGKLLTSVSTNQSD